VTNNSPVPSPDPTKSSNTPLLPRIISEGKFMAFEKHSYTSVTYTFKGSVPGEADPAVLTERFQAPPIASYNIKFEH